MIKNRITKEIDWQRKVFRYFWVTFVFFSFFSAFTSVNAQVPTYAHNSTLPNSGVTNPFYPLSQNLHQTNPTAPNYTQTPLSPSGAVNPRYTHFSNLPSGGGGTPSYSQVASVGSSGANVPSYSATPNLPSSALNPVYTQTSQTNSSGGTSGYGQTASVANAVSVSAPKLPSTGGGGKGFMKGEGGVSQSVIFWSGLAMALFIGFLYFRKIRAEEIIAEAPVQYKM